VSPLTIDPQGVIDLLRPTDNPVLTRALFEATDRKRPVADGSAFDNKMPFRHSSGA
jgi:hypothetical protein